MFTHLDVCSGIGGFALGLQMAGDFETIGFCEINKFCRRVLKKHWPKVWLHDDIKTLSGELIRQHCGERIDLLTAGIPCQPSSLAGHRQGSNDERWLWDELLRVVREVRPRILLAENPLGFVTVEPDGLDWFQDQLEKEGYETFAFVCGAEAVAAPHKRDRIWICGIRLANAGSGQRHRLSNMEEWPQGSQARFSGQDVDNPMCSRRGESTNEIRSRRNTTLGPSQTLGHTDCCRREEDERVGHTEFGSESASNELGDSTSTLYTSTLYNIIGRGTEHEQQGGEGARPQRVRSRQQFDWPTFPMGQGYDQHEWEEPRLVWYPKRKVGLATYGFPKRLVRTHNRRVIEAVGNSVVPHLVAIIGRSLKRLLLH